MSHSIAHYTGTRIDSSAKHIVQCKVNHDIFSKFFCIEEKKLTDSKYRYAMMKDELVLDVGRMTRNQHPGLFDDAEVKHAYPSVITTLGDTVSKEVMAGIRKYYRELSMMNEDLAIAYMEGTQQKVFPYRFGFVGVSVGTAYAIDLSGDNVGSVMIGGMVTVLNGHFPCYTGELVQWYFDFERDEYDEDGFRVPAAIPPYRNDPLLPVTGKESWYKERVHGGRSEANNGKNRVALIKAYRPIRSGNQRKQFLYGDKVRIVGRVVNGGMPWEPVDIFLSNTFV